MSSNNPHNCARKSSNKEIGKSPQKSILSMLADLQEKKEKDELVKKMESSILGQMNSSSIKLSKNESQP